MHFSDKLSRACKIRDEYSLVKDLVQDRERKRLAVAAVTAPYGNANDAGKGYLLFAVETVSACLSWVMSESSTAGSVRHFAGSVIQTDSQQVRYGR